MTVNLTPPTLHRMFSGPLMAEELERRYLRALQTVYRLEPRMFGVDAAGAELDPAAAIMRAVDVTLPVIDWDTPQRVDGITPNQQRITLISYPTTGETGPLTWTPQERQIGMPPEHFGLTGNSLTITVIGRTITAERLATVSARVRRHVDTNRAHQSAQLLTWREDTTRRIRDAVASRRALLATLPDQPSA